MGLPQNLESFVKNFSRLPGVGYKSAEKIGFYLLSRPKDEVYRLIDSLKALIENLKTCRICGNITVGDTCNICLDETRNRQSICVVEQVSDIFYIESTNAYRGLYHVLGGVISPLNGVMPDHLRIDSLVDRISKSEVKEIIFALSATAEGDTTALFIKELFRDSELRFTHLARGIPIGTELQYAGQINLSQAMKNREQI